MVLWNFDLLWKNYGTMEKTMVMYRDLRNFNLRREKTNYQKLRNFDLFLKFLNNLVPLEL